MEEKRLEEMEEENEGWAVEDDDAACWALKQIKKLEEEIQEKKDLAERQIYQVENWLESEVSGKENSINFFKAELFKYAQSLKEKDPGLKTHSLPFGKLQYRKRRPKWKYGDELLDTVKEMIPDVVDVKERVNKRNLKNLIKTNDNFKVLENGEVVNTLTGEKIDGLKIVEREEKFSVKTD